MTGIAIKATPVRNAPAWKRRILRYALDKELQLGDPVVMTDGTDEWFVFDDHRLGLDAITSLAAVIKKLSDLTLSDLPKDDEGEIDVSRVRSAIRDFVSVDRASIAEGLLEEDEDPVDGVSRIANLTTVMRSSYDLTPVAIEE